MELQNLREKMWETEEDKEYQSIALESVLRDVRGVKEEDPLYPLYLKTLTEKKAFYVPNNDLIISNGGSLYQSPNYGLYGDEGYCRLEGRLAIPLERIDGIPMGFVGYSNQDPKYLYPPVSVFDKGRYMMWNKDDLELALTEEYVFVVDGVFDKITLEVLGYPSASLCGSSLTEYHIAYLNFVPNVVFLPDNDQAGRRLVERAKQVLSSNVVEIRQEMTKDIDDFMKEPSFRDTFNRVVQEMKAESFMIDKIIRRE